MSVYFATAGGYMKIGYSKDPIARSTTLTTSGTRPDDLPRATDVTLLGWIPGDTNDEGVVHARFRGNRVKGEWFADVDVDAVRELIWNHPHGVDVQRMSAWAVFTMDRYPELTRDDLTSRGIPVEARPLEESHLLMDRFLTTPKSAS